MEMSVDHIANINDEEFVLVKNPLLQHGLNPEVCTSVLPTDVLVTEKGFDLYT